MKSDSVNYPWGTEWYVGGERHREDGPAIEWIHGGYDYYNHGKRHRLDGPAIILRTGETQWWVNGEDVDSKIKTWAKEMNIDLDNLSDQDKQLIVLYWANYGK